MVVTGGRSRPDCGLRETKDRLCEGATLARLSPASPSCGPAHRPATPGTAAEQLRSGRMAEKHLIPSLPADTGGRAVHYASLGRQIADWATNATLTPTSRWGTCVANASSTEFVGEVWFRKIAKCVI